MKEMYVRKLTEKQNKRIIRLIEMYLEDLSSISGMKKEIRLYEILWNKFMENNYK